MINDYILIDNHRLCKKILAKDEGILLEPGNPCFRYLIHHYLHKVHYLLQIVLCLEKKPATIIVIVIVVSLKSLLSPTCF